MEKLIQPLEYLQYERISDDVYYLGQSVVLRFSVQLAKYGSDGSRYHFHKEYSYRSTKTHSNEPYISASIKRTFDYYLSIETIKSSSTPEKEFIRIGVTEIMLVRDAFKRVLSWFTDSKYDGLFAYKEDKLIVTNPIPTETIAGLPMKKYLKIEPAVVGREIGDDYSVPGVIIYLSSEYQYIKMSLSKLAGLVYILENFNMYQSAQLMINYLGRPEFGTNMYSFEPVPTRTLECREIERTDVRQGRKIVPLDKRGLNGVEV